MRRLFCALLLFALPAAAEHLPFRSYGAAEGLEGSYVRFVMQDARGFIWVATSAGVSRFDGHEFRNYGADDGLPFPSARKIVETKDGSLVVLGRGKLARRAAGSSAEGPEFEALDPPGLAEHAGDLLDVVAAPDGTIVVTGTLGAVRVTRDAVVPIDLGPVVRPEHPESEHTWGAAFDGSGALWVARSFGITRVGPDGVPRTLARLPYAHIGSGYGWLPSMMVDRSKRVWLITVNSGAWRLADEGAGPIVAETIDGGGVRRELLRAFHEAPDGTFWIGTSNAALIRVETTAAGRRFVPIGRAEGFPDLEVSSILTDTQGNLWAGTAEAGLVRLADDGLHAWGEDDGLIPPGVGAILDGPDGGLFALVGGLYVAELREGRVETTWPMRGVQAGWGSTQLVASGAGGRFFVATTFGLAVYPRGTVLRDLRHRAPERLLGVADGLPGVNVHRLFATHDGTIWFGLIHVNNGVCRLERDARQARCFGPADGLPDQAWGSAFAEDAAGNLWAGLYGGGAFRFREGRWETWPEAGPNTQLRVESIRRDRKGRLWVAGSPGLLRIEGAETGAPSFRRFTRSDGIGGADTLDVAEDRFGDLYVSGMRGVDRFDSDGVPVRRYTSADGLLTTRTTALHADPAGDVWIGGSRGLARLVPVRPGAKPPPRVYLTETTVAGRRRAAAGSLVLGSDERTVAFGFTAPSFRAGESMRFQWRLAGSGDAEWSAPSTARSIVLAGLAPGGYRFDVRAVDAEGQLSEAEGVSFRIAPPVWRRGWFMALAGALSIGIAAAIYRARVARLLELERVRTRIATDLHDDVGASLSQIAVLSQLAGRQAARGDADVKGSLTRITDLSGSVVDAMSDVVWSINPARDRMSDLVHRMRRFAVDLFSENDVALKLDLPADATDEPLSPEVRRQIFLVFKEALRNAARHARASTVTAVFRREGDGLVLVIADDGRGIKDADSGSTAGSGLGLRSMSRRARAIGGTLEVRPGPSGGTEVSLRIPSPGRRSLSRWTGPPTERAS